MNQVNISDSEPIVEEAGETGINIALLNQVADYVEAHPEEFDMAEWAKSSGKYRPWYKRLLPPDGPEYTVGCVACHTVRLGGGNPFEAECNVPAKAQRLLRITDDQALRLFYWFNWPEPYRREYESNNPRETDRAWISARRFRHFIATNGAE